MRNIVLAFWRGVVGADGARRDGVKGADYDFLILEMGVDKPGDMEQLLEMLDSQSNRKIARVLDVAVFTGVHPVHMADFQFASLDAIAEEKGKILAAVKDEKDGGAILVCLDDARVMAEVKKNIIRDNMIRGIDAEIKSNFDSPKIISYGADDHAKLRVSEVEGAWEGVRFAVQYEEVRGEFEVPILGKQHVASFLPAIGIGLMMGMTMPDIVARMKTFRLPPGRLSLIEAKNDAYILDSSYNASPDAVKAAIQTMVELSKLEMKNGWSAKRKIFVFGNMNELGGRSEREHREIGRFLAREIWNCDTGDMLITVGEAAKTAAEELKKIKNDEEIIVKSFQTAEEAADFLELQLAAGDLILVKGSQNNVRLEKLVKRLMKAPESAPELLVRQEWK
jgi:UDP-N-acetylmuramyl pentapeptide synthase